LFYHHLSQIVAFSNNCLNLLKPSKVNGLAGFFKEKWVVEKRSKLVEFNSLQDLFLEKNHAI